VSVEGALALAPSWSGAEKVSVSFVIPVRDEADNVAPLLERLGPVVARLEGAEAIFVDDGSRDATRRLLSEAAAGRPWLRVFSLGRPLGKSAALAAGFRAARGDWIVTLDGDLQDDPREAPRLLAEIERGAELVVGRRRTRRDSLRKRVASAVFNWLVRRLTGVLLTDVNSGLRAMRAEVARGFELPEGRHRFLPVLAALSGRRVVEIDVDHAPRRHGRSKYGLARYARGLLDLVAVAASARRGTAPLGRPPGPAERP
jgi:dolichol-phosphate mannosyltransferase